jgi:hypothetical protein
VEGLAKDLFCRIGFQAETWCRLEGRLQSMWTSTLMNGGDGCVWASVPHLG